ncbi:MAG TPA: hypothetical protein EYQ50_14870 [Verrucomicrobiales bacterium]|nr:hypothetical protein [Verrucomicrobiales bacterium]
MAIPNPAALLQAGENLISVQVHNRNLTSSDLVFDMKLSAIIRDPDPPVLVSVAPLPGSVSSLKSVVVTFSEKVLTVSRDDLLINGKPADSLDSLEGEGNRYRFHFVQPREGPVDMAWDSEHTITDLSRNRFDEIALTSLWTYDLLDTVAPRLEIVVPSRGSVISRLDQIEVVFDEAVTGIDADDLLINGQSAVSMIGRDEGPYHFQFSQPDAGRVVVRWADGHQITDLAGTGNSFPGGQWNYDIDPTLANGEIVINEIQAYPDRLVGRKDDDGDVNDWIELFNQGDHSVDLTGWALTDDPDRITQWTFPSRIILPGQYLVVVASGKDRRSEGKGVLHTNFQLDRDGEYLALFNAELPPQLSSVLKPSFPEQRTGISYGLNDASEFVFFSTPTPGNRNSGGRVFSGVVEKPHASVRSGFFDRSFRLILTSVTEGATLRYTLDGSEPTENNGSIYREPISLNGSVNRPMVILRGAAFRSGFLPSRILNHSYVFPQFVLQQAKQPRGFPTAWLTRSGTRVTADYEMDPRIIDDPKNRDSLLSGLTALPTLSIVMNQEDLLGQDRGLYANPQGFGVAWERPVSAEFIFPEERKAFQIDAGFRLQGGSSRQPNKSRKHSLRLLFKGDYGPSRMEFPLFDDSPVERFDSLVLDNRLNFAWHYNGGSSPTVQRERAQYVRDQYVSDLSIALGHPAPHGRKFHLYLNGIYWGTTGIHERPDASFAAEYFGGEKEDYDSMKNTSGFRVLAGDSSAWNTLLSLADSRLSGFSHFEQMSRRVDMINLIDYMIVNIWVGNTDWPHHNWYIARRRIDGGQFKFFIWDAEHCLKSVSTNRSQVDNAGTPAQLYDQLRRHSPEFRLMFADRIQKHFSEGGVFYVDAGNPEWNPKRPERNMPARFYMKLIKEIEPALALESARWGDNARTNTPYRKQVEWQKELDWMLEEYLPARSQAVFNQFKQLNLFPSSTQVPEFSLPKGEVTFGALVSMTRPSGLIYFTDDGSDPRENGTGQVSETAQPYQRPIPINTRLTIKARTLRNGVWSALQESEFIPGHVGLPLHFTEIMYHHPRGEPYEFLEITNSGETPIPLGGFKLQGVGFNFPQDTVIQPRGVVVIASSAGPQAFADFYSTVQPTGYYTGQLSNGGESVTLLNDLGEVVISVDYKDDSGWSKDADGEGYSLEIMDLEGNPDAPDNWKRSDTLYGSPSVFLPHRLNPSVIINELMAGGNSNAGSKVLSEGDWIELLNVSQEVVSLSGWGLSDGDNSYRFTFPEGWILEPGEYRVVMASEEEFGSSGTQTGFSLSRMGETLRLTNPNGERIDSITFARQLSDYSLGRINGRWILNQPTAGVENMPAARAESTFLVINEWLVNPLPDKRGWIELHNTHPDLPIALERLLFSNGVSSSRYESRSFLEPGGFFRIWSDSASGFNRLDLDLFPEGGTLSLKTELGNLIDEVSYPAMNPGYSKGFIPDGSNGSADEFSFGGSPGFSNVPSETLQIRLSELMARNHGSISDPWGTDADWIELTNTADIPADLSGMALTDTLSDRDRFVFPNQSFVPSSSSVLVWFEDSQSPSSNSSEPFNTGFSLSGNGDDIFLLDAESRLIDYVQFGFQIPDRSIGLVDDLWRLQEKATPGEINRLPAALGSVNNLVFSEWMANPETGSDWFELFNPSNSPVSLTGLKLTDDPSIFGRDQFKLGPLSFIAAGSHVLLQADQSLTVGPDHVSFRLSWKGELLQLLGPTDEVIDEVDFGLQREGVSSGRLNDEASIIVDFTISPTPGSRNITDAEAVLLTRDIKISKVSLDNSGAVLLTVTLAGNATVQLEASENLVTWSALQQGTIQDGQVIFRIVPSLEVPKLFLRIRILQ